MESTNVTGTVTRPQEDKDEEKKQDQRMGSATGSKDGSEKVYKGIGRGRAPQVHKGIGCGRALQTQNLGLRSRPVSRSQTRRYEQMIQDDDINKGLNPVLSILHTDTLSTTCNTIDCYVMF